MKQILLFLISSVLTILVINAVTFSTETSVDPPAQMTASKILNSKYLPSDITNALSDAPIDANFFDGEAIVIMLGAPGCYSHQTEVLKWWEELRKNGDSKRVIALFTDPSLGYKQNRHDALLLRRASQADFPFLISSSTSLDLRLLNVRMPQVAVVRDGTIREIVDAPDEFRSHIKSTAEH